MRQQKASDKGHKGHRGRGADGQRIHHGDQGGRVVTILISQH